ncbi:MAG: cyclic-di-AMP receptor [Oscillospiraceae bacterium]|jgi:uncharacterized protein YaaQ|nr:cyclic-di-AMP receptor [Oscillospiraceae bacterium]
MKLVVAIVNNEDSGVVASALTKEKFVVTKLSTTGGFLMIGNTTFLIGAEDKDVDLVKRIINDYSKTRAYAAPTTANFGLGLRGDDTSQSAQVSVGGATVFVLSVDSMEKY